jgi:threonylcarbamoyladenosine tRNA methylthiotransferase MtaB
MRTFSINTLGCKVNQYEGQQIRELLEHRGLRQAEWPHEPDLVVVHTCCVTHTASAKSRQCIRKVLRLNPQSLVFVSGCLPAAQIGELSCFGENVHLVRNPNDLATTLTHWTQSKPNTSIKAKSGHKIKHKNEPASESERFDTLTVLSGVEGLPPLTSFKQQTRAFLKVQDGCDGYCSYCIVPKTRPVVHSKPAETALLEAQALVKSGHREIVVSGVFLVAYGQKSVRRKNWPDHRNDNLADLLDRMAQIPGLARIRLSSLEPADVTERLLDTFCKHRNIMPHLHLALQSGSDAVLKRMCRQYRISEFRKKIESIKIRLDRPAITTDIIVGFPGETDADFEQTLDLARSVGFAKMHVFPFSARRGTPAASMQDTVEKTVMKRRSEILLDLDVELGLRYRQQFIGETAEILIETRDDGREEERTMDESALVSRPSSLIPRLCGRSERYFKVYIEFDCRLWRGRPGLAPRWLMASGREQGQDALATSKIENNEIVRVTLAKNRQDGMVGIRQS